MIKLPLMPSNAPAAAIPAGECRNVKQNVNVMAVAFSSPCPPLMPSNAPAYARPFLFCLFFLFKSVCSSLHTLTYAGT